MVLNRALIISIALGVVLSVFCKVLYDKVGELQEANKSLQKALESNLKAAKEKDKRNQDELERLQKQLTELHNVDDACLDADINANLIEFMQQLQKDSAGTISFTFAK